MIVYPGLIGLGWEIAGPHRAENWTIHSVWPMHWLVYERCLGSNIVTTAARACHGQSAAVPNSTQILTSGFR